MKEEAAAIAWCYSVSSSEHLGVSRIIWSKFAVTLWYVLEVGVIWP